MIDIGKVYDSNNFGKFKIINYKGKIKNVDKPVAS